MNPAAEVSGREAAVLAQVDGLREALVALCGELVAQPSINPPGDTRGVAEVLRGRLAAAGLEPRLVCALPEMPNVVAVLDTGRPGPHLVTNVHMDTMDAGDLAAWTVPVHRMTRREGRLYGLGMGNMKGAAAAMTFAVSVLAEHREALCGRITFTAVSDEVVFGEHGAAHLLQAVPGLGEADGLLCGEGPGWMRLAVAEKGVLWLALSATAEGGHASGSRPGAGAVPRLAALVGAVDALSGQTAPLPPALSAVAATGDETATRSSVNVGTFTGGHFVSQIATSATAEVDVRLAPGLTMAQVEEQVRAAAAAVPGTGVARIKGWDANWTSPEDPFAQVVAGAAQAVRGEPAAPCVRLPASDASRWRRLGVPAVCYGPQPTLSAGVDDSALEQDVVDCAKVYALTALRLLARDA